MPKRGLPTERRMRADSHFVDNITSARLAAVGRMIEIDKIDPNPSQPRREMRGLDDLVVSIRERGILEPILVRPFGNSRFQIIAGERRYQAAKQVGLSMVPCVELEVDDRGCLEISLVENLQRRDLTAFEEAEAITRLLEEFRYTHEQIAKKLGRSRTSITETLSLHRMPERVKEECRRADISTKSTLMEIVRQPSEEDMLALVRAIAYEQLTRDQVRERTRTPLMSSDPNGRGALRHRPFIFKFKPDRQDFSLSLKFHRETVEPTELLATLEGIVEHLRQEIASGHSKLFENANHAAASESPVVEN